jgi:hypothetical protein
MMAAAAGIDSSMYDTLKHQVQQLKLEQQSLAGQRSKQKEVTPASQAHTTAASLHAANAILTPHPCCSTAAA